MLSTLFSSFIFWFPVVSFITWKVIRHFLARQKHELRGKVIFVTGCDTGFGNLLTKHLDKLGCYVFAGCLTKNGGDKLSKETSDKCNIINLDVTKNEQIIEAKKIVEEWLEKNNKTLWGIINNAGILIGDNGPGHVELTNFSAFEKVTNVNYFGTVRCCQNFISLLRNNGPGSRIINISSMAGRTASPARSAYFGSKWATIGFSECLRMEMSKFGIYVTTVEPGAHSTPIMTQFQQEKKKQIIREAYNKINPDLQKVYGADKFLENQFNGLDKVNKKICADPMNVVNAITDTLSSKYPYCSYKIGKDCFILNGLFMLLPQEITAFLLGRSA